MKILGIVIFIVSAFTLSASLSPENELELINKSYFDLNSFQMNFTHTLYDNQNMRKVLEKKEGVYIKSNTNTYQRTLNTEVLITKGYHIIISHDEKLISVGKYITPQSITLDNLPEELSSDLGKINGGKVSKLTNEENELTLPGESGTYSEIKLRYNSKSYLINAIHYNFNGNDMLKELGFKEPPYLVISCKNQKLNKNINKDIFNEKRYLIITGKKVKPASGFKNYTINNNL